MNQDNRAKRQILTQAADLLRGVHEPLARVIEQRRDEDFPLPPPRTFGPWAPWEGKRLVRRDTEGKWQMTLRTGQVIEYNTTDEIIAGAALLIPGLRHRLSVPLRKSSGWLDQGNHLWLWSSDGWYCPSRAFSGWTYDQMKAFGPLRAVYISKEAV